MRAGGEGLLTAEEAPWEAVSGRDLLDRAVELLVDEVLVPDLAGDERAAAVHEDARVLHVRVLQVDRVAVELGRVVAVEEVQLAVAGEGGDALVVLDHARELLAVGEVGHRADVLVVGLLERGDDLLGVDVGGGAVRELGDDAIVVELLEVRDLARVEHDVRALLGRQDREGVLLVRLVDVAEGDDVVGALRHHLDELAELLLELLLLEQGLEALLPDEHVEHALVGLDHLDLVQLEVAVLDRAVHGVDHDVELVVVALEGDALELRVVHQAVEGLDVEGGDGEEDEERGLEEAEELRVHVEGTCGIGRVAVGLRPA